MADIFKLDPAAYTPLGVSYLKAATEREARREYSRLRDIAQKRLKRLRAAPDTARTPLAVNYSFPTLESIGGDIHDVERQLAKIHYFLSNPKSTVTGVRKDRKARTIDSLIEHGFEIASKDLAAFGEFMEWGRSQLIGYMLPSDELAEMYEETRRLNLNMKELRRDFTEWVDRREDLKYLETGVRSGWSADDLRIELGIAQSGAGIKWSSRRLRLHEERARRLEEMGRR